MVQNSLGLKPNFAYTTKDVEREVQRVFHTGFFEMVEPEATDTRDGIALVLKVICFAQGSSAALHQTPACTCSRYHLEMSELGNGNGDDRR